MFLAATSTNTFLLALYCLVNHQSHHMILLYFESNWVTQFHLSAQVCAKFDDFRHQLKLSSRCYNLKCQIKSLLDWWENLMVSWMAKDFLPIARMRSSGLHPIPHTRAFSNGGGWVQSTCKFNRCTMTSPKKRIIVLQTNHCNRLYVQSLLPLSLLIAIKSILWLHVNSSIL